jgi:anti-sigma B factor antagonist
MVVSIKLAGADNVRLSLAGELDATTAPHLKPTLDRLVARAPWRVEIDLSRLRMIDSVGLGALIRLSKRLYTGGCPVVVSGLRDQPLLVFRLLGLDQRLAHVQAESRCS